jgi:hypothetical protein
MKRSSWTERDPSGKPLKRRKFYQPGERQYRGLDYTRL